MKWIFGRILIDAKCKTDNSWNNVRLEIGVSVINGSRKNSSLKDIFHGGHSAAKTVKAVKMIDFEKKALKSVKLYIFSYLLPKTALLSSTNIHFFKNVFT